MSYNEIVFNIVMACMFAGLLVSLAACLFAYIKWLFVVSPKGPGTKSPQAKPCTREPDHGGPCNGYPCHAAHDRMIKEMEDTEEILDDLESFMDNIDGDIVEALKSIDRLPPRPAGFPDRVDALIDYAKASHVEMGRLMGLIANPELLSVEVENGVIDMNHRVPDWAVKVIAGSLADSLGDAKNWRSFRVGPLPSIKGHLIVTVSRENSESYAEQVAVDQRQLIARAYKHFDAYGYILAESPDLSWTAKREQEQLVHDLYTAHTPVNKD